MRAVLLELQAVEMEEWAAQVHLVRIPHTAVAVVLTAFPQVMVVVVDLAAAVFLREILLADKVVQQDLLQAVLQRTPITKAMEVQAAALVPIRHLTVQMEAAPHTAEEAAEAAVLEQIIAAPGATPYTAAAADLAELTEEQ